MSLYKRKDSDIWWANVTHAGNRVRRSTGETDRTAAQKIHNQIQIELWKAVPAVRGATWGKAVLAWVEAETRSDSELLSLGKFAVYFDDRALSDVTAEAVHKALAAFTKSAGTYTRYRTMIAAILNLAKTQKQISEVPKLFTRKDKKTKPRDWITREQWLRLLVELPGHMTHMAIFAIETGLRQANVLNLTWDRVDLARKIVWIEAEEMKADQALVVPLSDGAIGALEAVKGQHSTHCFTYRGNPVKEIKTAFHSACIRAGLGSYVDTDDGPRYSGFTWHGFRHTWATWHVQNGTPLDVLQKLGGWADLRMVMRYAHHSAGHLASFANNASRTDK